MQIKNRKKILFIILLSLFTFNNNLIADEFNITAKEVLVDKENEILTGIGSVEAVDSEGKLINADKIPRFHSHFGTASSWTLLKKSVKIFVSGKKEQGFRIRKIPS